MALRCTDVAAGFTARTLPVSRRFGGTTYLRLLWPPFLQTQSVQRELLHVRHHFWGETRGCGSRLPLLASRRSPLLGPGHWESHQARQVGSHRPCLPPSGCVSPLHLLLTESTAGSSIPGKGPELASCPSVALNTTPEHEGALAHKGLSGASEKLLLWGRLSHPRYSDVPLAGKPQRGPHSLRLLQHAGRQETGSSQK